MRTSAIVVGTDGASSRAAVEWAAREAARRHALLRIVHAFDWEWTSARFDSGKEYLDLARQLADAVTVTAMDQARAVAPTIKVEADALIGNPAPRLLEVAEDASLIVLGNRGRGGFTSLMLGSVSQRVATHATCPVVVVRGRGDVTDGPIAVGVDDGDTTDHVLQTAFQAASDRDAALTVVRAYLPVIPLWLGDVPPAAISTPEQDTAEHTRVEDLLVPWRQKFPQVPVEVMVSHDSAAAVLVGVSHGAQLVIVGSRGRGTITGALLGSTGMQLLHHADCPVWIARAAKDGTS
jgi:nucleotide-binding universal stress UspA family protein